MKLRWLFCFLTSFFLTFSFAIQAAPLPLPRMQDLLFPTHIRVRLAEAVPHVWVRGHGLKILEKGKPARSLAEATSPDSASALSAWELRCQNGRIRAAPSDGGPTQDLVEPVTLQPSGGWIEFRGHAYREQLRVHSVGSFCEVVNQVEIEKYLGGLVNSEFNSKWNEESIGAQIVAARTYALFQITAARGDPERHYDVDATVSDQVYDGMAKEDPRSQRLVERTRGWVLTAGAGARPVPMKAFYHSTCGGMTELPEHVWGNSFAGFKRPVRCPYCGGSPALNWQLDVSASQVAEAFRRAWASSDDASKAEWSRGWPAQWQSAVRGRRLLDVSTRGTDVEGRVSEVVTFWADVDAKTGRASRVELRLSGARFREWLGPAKFRSASFQVVAHGPGAWHFQGRGNGHGVGMCQWGAKTMGERGFKTASILRYYYPDAVLRKVW